LLAVGCLGVLLSGCVRASATPAPEVPLPPLVTPVASAPSRQATGQITEITGTLSEYSISLSDTSARLGTVRFTVQNVGRRKHNLRVVGNGVDEATRDLSPGQTGQVEVRFADPGPYTVYCDLADHADRGMQLTFTVES
jgi:plastocyanin